MTDDTAGETYWKVANGIRLTGMPGYQKSLSTDEMWQVSLLLANADKLPASAASALASGAEAPRDAAKRLLTGFVPGVLATVLLASAGMWPITAAHAQAVSPSLLVLEKGARSLAIVDPEKLAIVARVDAGDDPHEVVASEDGRFAYITNYGAFSTPGHTLSVVDLAAKKPLPPVDLGALRAPHGLELAGGKVYFTAEGSKMIGRYDPASRQVDWALGIGQDRTHMLVVARDLQRIFTSNVNSDTVTILEHAKGGDVSGWTMTHVPVGKGPEGFDVSPDGRELWAANSQDGTLSIIDVGARKVVQTVALNTKRSNRLKFTPDGTRVLISDLASGDLLILDAATRREVKRIGLGHGAAGIVVPGDGSRAFVAVSPDDCVAVVDLRSLSVTGRVSTGKGPDGMAWIGK